MVLATANKDSHIYCPVVSFSTGGSAVQVMATLATAPHPRDNLSVGQYCTSPSEYSHVMSELLPGFLGGRFHQCPHYRRPTPPSTSHFPPPPSQRRRTWLWFCRHGAPHRLPRRFAAGIVPVYQFHLRREPRHAVHHKIPLDSLHFTLPGDTVALRVHFAATHRGTARTVSPWPAARVFCMSRYRFHSNSSPASTWTLGPG